MQIRRTFILVLFFILFPVRWTAGQENFFGHYFIAASSANPAHAGDTRFVQFQLDERVQPTVTNEVITNTFVSYNQKLRNHRSGIGISIDDRSAKINEFHARLNYSYTLMLFRKYWVKAGLGVSYNRISTNAQSYKYPDQYNRYGFTGLPTGESFINEKDSYAGVSVGFAVYDEYSWITFSLDNINKPGIEIIGDRYQAPVSVNFSWGLLFPIDKHKRPRRIFNSRGGLEPYSSIGPILSYYKNGPFHIISLGVNAFTKPVFWGINFQYNAIYDEYLSGGSASINFLAGYRIESLCIAYSYDYMINRAPAVFKGAHEVSVIYYLFSVKEDYKKNKLFPFTNQLMY